MALYRRGSSGPEVKRIQQKMQEQGLYLGPLDGIYGGGTESAVTSYQRNKKLSTDGIVGPKTWQHLFDEEEIAEPAILLEPLSYRCLALTGSFETGMPPPDCFAGLSGDFDAQCISFGVLQWNFGQGSLQPLLEKMNEENPDVMQDIFVERCSEIQQVLNAPYQEQMRWGRSVQNLNQNKLIEPWHGLFKSLGRSKVFQNLQVKAAGKLFDDAKGLAREYDLKSERAVAVMFDIKVQNGSIYNYVKEQIMRDFASLPDDAGEQRRLQIVANRRAEGSNPRWVEDVRTRKLVIARGEGMVHGMHYNLAMDYGIRLDENFR